MYTHELTRAILERRVKNELSQRNASPLKAENKSMAITVKNVRYSLGK